MNGRRYVSKKLCRNIVSTVKSDLGFFTGVLSSSQNGISLSVFPKELFLHGGGGRLFSLFSFCRNNSYLHLCSTFLGICRLHK